jgi:16S rRNA (guanine(966)-N(2))-methyltransferase RsmD
MSLRIIGGTFKGRPLKSPKGNATRPTLAILRKAVFDILQTDVEGADFLDLFAGSGAMGLEAMSRGASSATFVDNNRQALLAIDENRKTLQLEKQTTLLPLDALVALKKLAKTNHTFHIIYIDPPYAISARKTLLPELIHFIDEYRLLSNGGHLFIEEAVPATLDLSALHHLHYLNSRTFSQSTLHQYRANQ